MILRNLLWVGLGSFAGGVLRYLVALYTRNHGYDGFFPWGTLTVNLAGSFLLGVFFALAMRFPLFAGEMRLLLRWDCAADSPRFRRSCKRIFCSCRADNILPQPPTCWPVWQVACCFSSSLSRR